MSGLSEKPTATHLTADVHDTDWSAFVPVFGGLGAGCIFQAVPFQRSARTVRPLVNGSEAAPTAVHARGELHDTLSSVLVWPCRSTGSGSTIQFARFELTANGADRSDCCCW